MHAGDSEIASGTAPIAMHAALKNSPNASKRLEILSKSTDVFQAAAMMVRRVGLVGLDRNRLGRGQATNSSFAIADGDIYIRTFTHLWCIGKQK